MLNSQYVGLSALVSLRNRVDTLAHNVANLNTPGFRAEGLKFEELVTKLQPSKVSFVTTGTSYISREVGSMSKTDNPLDVAVRGTSWLSLQTPYGQVYTRDGRMNMSPDGGLKSINGYDILDSNGSPISLDPNGGRIDIGQDGTISQNKRAVGKIGLFSIDEDTKLSRFDNSSVVANGPVSPTTDFTQNNIIQGYVEGSNVNPVLEMSKLIEITRNFDNIAAAIDKNEASQLEAIHVIGG
jgi:flagellar basal-body rod protein FlgF